MAVSKAILLERGRQDDVERIWQENMEQREEYEKYILKQIKEAKEDD